MNKNEEIFQKLRDFRMEKMIELKNSGNEENIDIEDVVYCGQLDFEVNGEIKKKDPDIEELESLRDKKQQLLGEQKKIAETEKLVEAMENQGPNLDE